MIAAFPDFTTEPIHDKYAWRICDFVTVNSERLKREAPLDMELYELKILNSTPTP